MCLRGGLDPSVLLPELAGDIHMHLEVSDSSRCTLECSVVSCLAVLSIAAMILEAEQGKGRWWFSLICIFFSFLGPHLQHVEIPWVGVKMAMQLLAYTIATAMPDA